MPEPKVSLPVLDKPLSLLAWSLVSMLMIAGASFAQNTGGSRTIAWELVSTTDAQTLYRSTQIISKTPYGTIRAWEKIVPRTDTPEGRQGRLKTIGTLIGMVGEARANSYSYHLKIEEYDCREGSKRTLQFKFYDDKGRNIQNVPEFHYTRGGKKFEGPPPPISKNEKPDWFHPSPNSVGETILKAVCGVHRRTSVPSQDFDNVNVYRSREYGFEITFPSGWVVNEGSEKDVAVRAINQKGSSINVVVSPYSGHDPTEEELSLMANLGAVSTKNEYPSAVIIDKGLRYLSGKQAPYQKYRVTHSAQGYSVTHIVMNYTVFKNSKVYTITTSAPVNSYAELEPLLNASINSFAVRGQRR